MDGWMDSDGYFRIFHRFLWILRLFSRLLRICDMFFWRGNGCWNGELVELSYKLDVSFMDRNGSPGLSTPFHLALSVKPWDQQRWAEIYQVVRAYRPLMPAFYGWKLRTPIPIFARNLSMAWSPPGGVSHLSIFSKNSTFLSCLWLK